MTADRDILSADDQALIDAIKAKVQSGTITYMQEHWGHEAELNPLATLEDIQKAEAESGKRTPPLIRELLLQVADGGFGPGYETVGTCKGMNLWPLSGAFEMGIYQVNYFREKLEEIAASEDGVYTQEEQTEAAEYLQAWSTAGDLMLYGFWGCQCYVLVDVSRQELPIYYMDGDNIGPSSHATLREWWQAWLDGTITQG